MKKLLLIFLSLMLSVSYVSALYMTNFEEDKIVTTDVVFDERCEEIYIKTYRRREMTSDEKKLCQEYVDIKIDQELNYKKEVLGNY